MLTHRDRLLPALLDLLTWLLSTNSYSTPQPTVACSFRSSNNERAMLDVSPALGLIDAALQVDVHEVRWEGNLQHAVSSCGARTADSTSLSLAHNAAVTAATVLDLTENIDLCRS
jgi:hypothetical protein